MKQTATRLLLLTTLMAALPAAAQEPTTMRSDAIWAPTTSADITLDGSLDEAPWASAPAITITYGQRAGDPGSGYVNEGGQQTPSDPTLANVRFLVSGGQLYMGADVADNSIGGSREFNRKDGFLMSIVSAEVVAFGGVPTNEYFYSYWYPNLPKGEPVPDVPGFIGRYGNFDDPLDRTPEQIAAWDAVTVVDGTPNDDSGDPDTGYTVEMRFDLTELGYDLTTETQIAFSISVYDVDGFFPFNDQNFAANRTWWQNPFNATVYNYGRIFVDPDVTADGELPEMPYDFIIANGEDADEPTIDGALDEDIWDELDGFVIEYVTGDDDEDALAIRASYPGIGPYFSRQFLADVDGDPDNDPPIVVDPARATVKWFHRDNTLYVGVDIQDEAISSDDAGAGNDDFWDGFRIGLNDATELDEGAHVLLPRDLAVRLGDDGNLVPERGLLTLLSEDEDAVQFAASLDGTLNDPFDSDNGYQIEMAIDLTAVGYPADLGNRVLFVGASLSDYDALDDPSASYGSRIWFFRERDGASAAYAYLAPAGMVASEGGPDATPQLELLGAAPNPFGSATTLRYALPESGRVTVEVYDMLGRRVRSLVLGAQPAGANAVQLDAAGLAAGTYLYRVHLDGASGANASPVGKATVLR